MSHDAHSGGSGCSSSSTSEVASSEVSKGSLLVSCHNLSDALESSLDAAGSGEKLSKASLAQLSSQAVDVHGAGTLYVDNIPATWRFRFRSLLTKLHEQSRDLRDLSIGSGSSAASSAANRNCGALVSDLSSTVKDLVSIVQR